MKFYRVIKKLLNPSGALVHLSFALVPFLFIDMLSLNMILILCICFLVNLFNYGINNTFDIDTDSKNLIKRNRNPFVSNEIKKNQALIVLFFLLFLGVALSLTFFGALTFYLLLGVSFSIFYSIPPFRFKGKFIFDMLFHGLAAISFMLFSFFILSVNQNYLLSSIVVCFLISTLFNLENEIRDYDADKNVNLKTTVVTLGKRISYHIYLILFIILYIFLLILLSVKIHLLISIPIFILFIILLVKIIKKVIKKMDILIFQPNIFYYPLTILFIIIMFRNFLVTLL